MDIRCPQCSEPWDNDYIHDYAEADGSTYAIVSADVRVRGCEAFGERHGALVADPAIGALYDLLGDDMDGAAAMFEDFGL
jgi:hypothetical protein